MGIIDKIKANARLKTGALKKDIQSQIVVEQDEIAQLNRQIRERWNKGVDNLSEDEVTTIDVLTIELERRTKRCNELISQLSKLDDLTQKHKDGGITADTLFKGLVSIATVVLVLYAEESRPIISKAMGFVVRPRL